MSTVGLSQTTSQQQVLAPQMRQSLEVLQVTSTELMQIVNQVLDVNPTIELEGKDQSLDEMNADEVPQSGEVSPTEDDWREDFIMEQGASEMSRQSEETRDFLYNSIVAPESLQSHLTEQLMVSGASTHLKEVALFMIGAINDQGFLDQGLTDIVSQCGCTLDDAKDAKSLIQTFTPDGVGAEDLQECLMLQLEKQGKVGTLEHSIVGECLPLLAKRKFVEIAKRFGADLEATQEAVEEIKRLNPHPGLEFAASGQVLVEPDVVVERNDEGEIEISLTNANIPALKISEDYKSMLPTLTSDAKAKVFVKNSIRDGRFLIKAIAQRQETILKITKEILTIQDGFLDKGSSALKPMTMNEVAEKIEVHPTTVSRAVAGKYLKSPQGITELRSFFSTGYQADGGEVVSNASVKNTIAKLVEAESKQKPLSDAAIEKKLKESGLNVARRTVAKYREQLGILPSYLRKEI